MNQGHLSPPCSHLAVTLGWRERKRRPWSLEGKCAVNKMQIDYKWTQSGNEADARTGSGAAGQSASTLSPHHAQPRTKSSVCIYCSYGNKTGFKVHITCFIGCNGILMRGFCCFFTFVLLVQRQYSCVSILRYSTWMLSSPHMVPI